MIPNEQKVRDFFSRYEALFQNSLGDHPQVDVDAIVASFADYFVESSPVGVHGGPNNEQFHEMIPQGYAFYRQIGTTRMKAGALDITSINDQHVMAKVHWISTFKKQDGSTDTIEFDNVYFLTLASGEPKIFAYVTPDEQAALREHGLIPE